MGSSTNKRWGNRVIGILILLVAAVLLSQAVSAYLFPETATLHLGEGKFKATIADKDATRIKGLSGTSQLAEDHAMVLIFDTNSRWGIWMKDMNYPIDIIWLDDSKRVVDFVMNVPPESYPNKTFLPREDARYVVELQSGMVKKKGIRVGQQAFFSGTSREL